MKVSPIVFYHNLVEKERFVGVKTKPYIVFLVIFGEKGHLHIRIRH